MSWDCKRFRAARNVCLEIVSHGHCGPSTVPARHQLRDVHYGQAIWIMRWWSAFVVADVPLLCGGLTDIPTEGGREVCGYDHMNVIGTPGA